MTDPQKPGEPVKPIPHRIGAVLAEKYPELAPAVRLLNTPKGRLGIALALVAIVACAIYTDYARGVAREMQFDIERISDLQQIKLTIQDFYDQNRMLPDSLKGLETRANPAYVRDGYLYDGETRRLYEYKELDHTSYQVCGNFHYSTQQIQESIPRDALNPVWDHDAGHHCFQVTVNAPPEKLKLLDQ